MTTYRPIKPRQRKAAWYRARHGDQPPTIRKFRKVRTIYRIRPVSKRRAKVNRAYAAKARAWKTGRPCIGVDLGLDSPCKTTPHLCDDVHHQRGKLGPLLMDERFWIPTCRQLHDWIGANIAAARTTLTPDGLPLLCQPGEWNRPVKEAA
jgi:hypothetical protein